MKALVVYDSVFGNTEKTAKAVAGALPGEVRLLKANEAKQENLEAVDLLVVGSPTRGFRATDSVDGFIKGLSPGSLQGTAAAAFDTRIPEEEVGKGLRFLMKMGGYAAPRISNALKKKGASVKLPPEGFFVLDREGPLRDGEEERAAAWAKKLAEGIS